MSTTYRDKIPFFLTANGELLPFAGNPRQHSYAAPYSRHCFEKRGTSRDWRKGKKGTTILRELFAEYADVRSMIIGK